MIRTLGLGLIKQSTQNNWLWWLWCYVNWCQLHIRFPTLFRKRLCLCLCLPWTLVARDDWLKSAMLLDTLGGESLQGWIFIYMSIYSRFPQHHPMVQSHNRRCLNVSTSFNRTFCGCILADAQPRSKPTGNRRATRGRQWRQWRQCGFVWIPKTAMVCFIYLLVN
jgi:hypothetical protein